MTDWQSKAKPLREGDTVRLTAAYMDNTGQLPATGRLVRLELVCDLAVATVDFGGELRKMSVKCLEAVKGRGR